MDETGSTWAPKVQAPACFSKWVLSRTFSPRSLFHHLLKAPKKVLTFLLTSLRNFPLFGLTFINAPLHATKRFDILCSFENLATLSFHGATTQEVLKSFPEGLPSQKWKSWKPPQILAGYRCETCYQVFIQLIKISHKETLSVDLLLLVVFQCTAVRHTHSFLLTSFCSGYSWTC